MNDMIETFEIYSQHNPNTVCKMDPMLFLVLASIFAIILYIMQLKTK